MDNEKKKQEHVKKSENGLLIAIEEGWSNFSIDFEYRPYSVWLHCKGRSSAMPIGNMIYPHKHSDFTIGEVVTDEDGLWLELVKVNK